MKKKKTMVTVIKSYNAAEKKRAAQQVPKPALKSATKPARTTQEKRRARKSAPVPAIAKGAGSHVEFNPMRDLPEK